MSNVSKPTNNASGAVLTSTNGIFESIYGICDYNAEYRLNVYAISACAIKHKVNANSTKNESQFCYFTLSIGRKSFFFFNLSRFTAGRKPLPGLSTNFCPVLLGFIGFLRIFWHRPTILFSGLPTILFVSLGLQCPTFCILHCNVSYPLPFECHYYLDNIRQRKLCYAFCFAIYIVLLSLHASYFSVVFKTTTNYLNA